MHTSSAERNVAVPIRVLQFADIAYGNPVPIEAQREIDLRTS